MFIHGGVSDEDEILGDCFLYSIIPQKWIACSINEETPGPKLCNHTIALVLPGEQKYNPKLSLYKLTEMRLARRGELRVSIFILLIPLLIPL